jgi:hypothetical protein
VALWLESETNNVATPSYINEKLKRLKHDSILNQVKDIIENHPEIALESIGYLVELTSKEKIKEVIALLNDKVNDNKNDEVTSSNSGPSTDVSSANTTTTSPPALGKAKETVKSNSSTTTTNTNKK